MNEFLGSFFGCGLATLLFYLFKEMFDERRHNRAQQRFQKFVDVTTHGGHSL